MRASRSAGNMLFSRQLFTLAPPRCPPNREYGRLADETSGVRHCGLARELSSLTSQRYPPPSPKCLSPIAHVFFLSASCRWTDRRRRPRCAQSRFFYKPGAASRPYDFPAWGAAATRPVDTRPSLNPIVFPHVLLAVGRSVRSDLCRHGPISAAGPGWAARHGRHATRKWGSPCQHQASVCRSCSVPAESAALSTWVFFLDILSSQRWELSSVQAVAH